MGNQKSDKSSDSVTFQDKLVDEKDEFVDSLNLKPEKIREDIEKMRDIEGFPNGDVEDILELSNPPYYTAYPNPYIKDFIDWYGTPYDEDSDNYNIEPFIENESYGRTDSVYNIHFYHTKVPPQAIENYIDHYTTKNDIIIDFFAGSGMTGVAALRLSRYPIIIDLSTLCGFIDFNNLKKIDLDKFNDFAYNIYNKVYSEYSSFYGVDGCDEIQRNFTVWTSIHICPFCINEFKFYEADSRNRAIICPKCNSEIKSKDLKYKMNSNGTVIYEPIEIHYIKKNKRYNIPINEFEKNILKEIEKITIPFWFPRERMPEGDESRRNDKYGFTHTCHFYTKRNLLVLSAFFHYIQNYAIEEEYKNRFRYVLTAAMSRLTIFNRYMPRHNRHVGPLSGTLYLPKLFAEINPFKNIKEKIDAISKANYNYKQDSYFVSNQSATDLQNIPENSIDYIFIDPPFGENIMYSELNFIYESWLKVFTNNKKEAIVNNTQNKDELDYFNLIKSALIEGNRILKPNRWITLEFHNSKASIWRIIQEGLFKSGFVVAQVLTLDKQKGTTKQLTAPGTVKNDLIINAYKPDKNLYDKFSLKGGMNLEKEFIKMHLNKLPVEPNVERTSQMLYSKFLAYYLQNGFEVRLDASEFYDLLKNTFEERDNYWFNNDQIAKYEKFSVLNIKLGKIDFDQTILGISDEKTAIMWLIQFLKIPKTYDEIYTEFTKNLLTSQDKMPELKIILDENFSTKNNKYRLPSDLERKEKEEVRDKRLMKEFNEILLETQNNRKIKDVRKESLLHGLMKIYKEKDVETIKSIGERLDKNLINSDDDISAIIDWAQYQ